MINRVFFLRNYDQDETADKAPRSWTPWFPCWSPVWAWDHGRGTWFSLLSFTFQTLNSLCNASTLPSIFSLLCLSILTSCMQYPFWPLRRKGLSLYNCKQSIRTTCVNYCELFGDQWIFQFVCITSFSSISLIVCRSCFHFIKMAFIT